ncbi:hypothetical protein SMC26_23225 [Actinomadura fulvescens]|uniref:Chaplin domain-containing protein n=1 Tax=Actinomadura fulvescens TaxID=46160 RepID=A0ABP6DEG3_9ACTN
MVKSVFTAVLTMAAFAVTAAAAGSARADNDPESTPTAECGHTVLLSPGAEVHGSTCGAAVMLGQKLVKTDTDKSSTLGGILSTLRF